jgi:hypothetical protein
MREPIDERANFEAITAGRRPHVDWEQLIRPLHTSGSRLSSTHPVAALHGWAHWAICARPRSFEDAEINLADVMGFGTRRIRSRKVETPHRSAVRGGMGEDHSGFAPHGSLPNYSGGSVRAHR